MLTCQKLSTKSFGGRWDLPPAAFHLRDLLWTERETLIGKVVDFEYLAGATKGRMGRIFRLRDDLVPGTSLGL